MVNFFLIGAAGDLDVELLDFGAGLETFVVVDGLLSLFI